jgi:predicted transposase/invertase (TIGR01784 family)
LLEVELLNLFSSEVDKQAVSLFLNWFRQLALHGRIESGDYQSLEFIYRNEQEVKTMLITALEREKQRIFQDGLLEGKQEGKQEGRIEGKIEAAKEMLAKGMEITLVSEITNLPEEQLSQLKDELSSVADFSDNR